MGRQIQALLILVLLSSSFASLLPASVEPTVRIIMTISDRPVADRVPPSKVGDPLYQESIVRQLEGEARAHLEQLRRLGVPFTLVDVLTRVLHAAVIELPGRFASSFTATRTYHDQNLHLTLDKSTRWIRATDAHRIRTNLGTNLTGQGILVAVVDTGIDYTHPDLGGGLGPNRKVVGGYDFVDDDSDPMDEGTVEPDGTTIYHGTQVAGIVAADGALQGVAPKARLLAYRVVDRDGNIRTSDVARALERAVKEGARVVNISLGTDADNEPLNRAAENAVRAGVVLAAAAGNEGPDLGTVSSPATDPRVISVAASLNNVSMSLSAQLIVPSIPLNPVAYPMNGSTMAPRGITGRLVFVNYARTQDLRGVDLRGAIALAARGPSPERVYFSLKESNVAAKDALALIVYNNVSGNFRGDLIHEFNPPDYQPRIPVVSISLEDGLKIRQALGRGNIDATLRVYVDPDSVAFFSSRGPASAFYIKPDLAAPGTFINSTSKDSRYQVASGTSFAAPHAAGAAALILQRYPGLTPSQVGALLTTSAVLLRDTQGSLLSINEQGAGRLDVLAAVTATVTPQPFYVFLHLGDQQRVASRLLNLTSLLPSVQIEVGLVWNHPETIGFEVTPTSYTLSPTTPRLVNITAQLRTFAPGVYEGRLQLSSSSPVNVQYVPLIVEVNNASLRIQVAGPSYEIFVLYNQTFRSGRLEVTDPKRSIKSYGLSDLNEAVTLTPTMPGDYWIEAQMRTERGRIYARAIIQVLPAAINITEEHPAFPVGETIPLRPLQVIFGTVATFTVIALIMLVAQRGRRREPV